MDGRLIEMEHSGAMVAEVATLVMSFGPWYDVLPRQYEPNRLSYLKILLYIVIHPDELQNICDTL